MGSIEHTFGVNAGKIWRALDKNGPQSQTKLMKTTRLNKEDFYTAVGWLAKENKIFFNDTTFTLGENNFDKYIGQNAGKVWKIINTVNEVDANYIPQLAGINEKDTYYAIGWLAKEGKITGRKVKPVKPQIKIKIKN